MGAGFSLPGALALLCEVLTLHPRACLLAPLSSWSWGVNWNGRRAGGYCRETEGGDLGELLMFVALKKRQQCNEMMKNWVQKPRSLCSKLLCSNQPRDLGEVAQVHKKAGGGTARPDRTGLG